MSEDAHDALESSSAAARAVVDAIQKVMAARLGRAFVPLAALFVSGTVVMVRGGTPLVAVGAILTGATMLAYGLRVVQLAVGRPLRWWMTFAMAGSLVPPSYALYLVGWVGFRGLATGSTPTGWMSSILGVMLGVWVLRSWMQIVEVERLARAMTFHPEEEGDAT